MKKRSALKLKRYKGEDKDITITPSHLPFPSLLVGICFVRGRGDGFPLGKYTSLLGHTLLHTAQFTN